MTTKKSVAKKKLTKQRDLLDLPTPKKTGLFKLLGIGVAGLLVLFILITLSLRIAYAGRIYPGVWGHGVYLGGLTPKAAAELMQKQTNQYLSQPIVVEVNGRTVLIEPKDITLTYSNETLGKEVMRLGREGGLIEQVTQQWLMLIGATGRDNANLDYDVRTLAATSIAINNELSTDVANAQYEYSNGSVGFSNGSPGKRLDFGLFGLALYSKLANLGDGTVATTTDTIEPSVDSSTLQANSATAQSYASSPLVLSYEGKTWQVEPTTTLGWLHSTSSPEALVYKSDTLSELYGKTAARKELEFDPGRIDSYLTGISKEVDRNAIDAQLNVVDGRATVFVQSQDGKRLNISKTRDAILASLAATDAERTIALAVDTTKPAVTQESISNLGINELLSEGVSYFPGSTANRITNIRVGAARYNGVLLKPGEVFSFGKLLGPVGPEQGYTPGWVILGDRQEEQYGGGLCQVSSTAFRAALLAGLPILERVNHAFAISYYTAPYGVPGVDATIYYPPVDFKFRNDTDKHILIQTELVGTTLKFRFYGTKKKEGVIRGPFFVSGSSDVNQPSHTVFYRDIKVNGQTVKTDTFNTYYQSALKFPKPESQ